MSIDVIRVREEPPAEPETPSTRRVFDVSCAETAEVEAYARDTDAEELYLERKGDRTFLVAA